MEKYINEKLFMLLDSLLVYLLRPLGLVSSLRLLTELAI
jgi:hypothetical protein